MINVRYPNSNTLKLKNRIPLLSLFILAAPPLAAPVNAFELPAGNIGGVSYVKFNENALATMFDQSMRTSNNGVPYGELLPTSNTPGNRFLYVDRFIDSYHDTTIKYSGLASDSRIANGNADPIAVEQWRVFDPSQSVPLTQPRGGYQLPIDSLAAGIDFGAGTYGWTASNYDPNPNLDPSSGVPLQISLGGSFRLHSDFQAPGGTLWFNNLGIQYSPSSYDYTPKWYVANLAGQGVGSIFELINPVFGVNSDTGLFTLEADFKWGDSQWSNFFRVFGTEVSEKVMGHLSVNPSIDPTVVPVPAAVWLFGSALLGLMGYKRRSSFY